MKNENKTTVNGGVGATGLLQVALIVLKLLNKIEWSWVWVLSPTWISIVIVLIVIVIIVLMAVRRK